MFALAAREPRMREFYQRVPVLPFLERALEAPFTFRRTGARISGSREPRAHRLAPPPRLGRGRSSSNASGSSACSSSATSTARTSPTERSWSVRARSPIRSRRRRRSCFEPLPGEVALEYPPGTVVVMDGPVLHSALRGAGQELRMICGAHVQSKLVERPHPEDDESVERARVALRHRAYRWGLRNGRKWVAAANRAALPESSSY